MTKLTTEFLSKLQDSLLQFQDSYSDPADKENYGIFVDALHVLDEFKAAKEKLIAYEQAAEKPYGYLEPCDFPRTTATVYPEKDKYAFMPLYAAPVLPKQPEHSRQQFESLCNQFWNWAEFDEINHDEDPLLEWNGSNYTNRVTAALWKMYQAAPAQPVIPEQNKLRDLSQPVDPQISEYEKALQNEPQNIPENIPTAHSAYISFDALMAAVSEVTGVKREFDATPEKGYQAVPFMNFNSLSRIVEMFRSAQPDQLSMTSERELFKAWNNDIDCPIAGLEPSNAAWRAWISRAAIAPAQPVIPRELCSFVTDADIAALHRFAECCDDPESGGHDLEKEQVQRLEKIGALQRSGRISYITDFGDYLISATAPINAQPVSEPCKLPDGWVMVPQQIFLDASDIESICSQCGDGHKSGYGDFTDGLLWVGDIQCDNGTIMHGLHISSSDYQEEGGLTLAEFKAPAQEGE